MNETLITWLVFIAAFGGMVIIHELGHFIAARLVRVEVEEFGLGLPTPGAVTLFTWQGTRFTLNWLPLGGFVRPKGENDPNIEGGLAAAAPWKRLFVLSAGPLMNLIAAVLIFSLIVGQVGGIISASSDTANTGNILITEVVPDSPAEAGGLKVGDVLIAGNGDRFKVDDEASQLIMDNEGTPITFTVLRDGREIELTITPRMNESAGRPMIGIGMCGGCEFQPINNVFDNLRYSMRLTGAQIYALVTLPVRLMQGSIPAEQGRLIGLIGIFDIMQQSVSVDVENARTQEATPSNTSPDPFNQPVQTLFLVAILSISLGIFNLFPFPALDGGRILFVLPELLFRKRVPHEFENLVHGVGMTILILFMIYVNIRDVIEPIATQFP